MDDDRDETALAWRRTLVGPPPNSTQGLGSASLINDLTELVHTVTNGLTA